MFCPECGKTIEEGVVFCPNCGVKVDEVSQKVSPAMTKKGFFASLFDFSFTDFITTKIIKFLYILGHIFAGLVALGLALALIIFAIPAFRESKVAGFAALIFSLIFCPLVYLLLVIVGRIFLEIIIVIFRIAEDIRDIARQKRT